MRKRDAIIERRRHDGTTEAARDILDRLQDIHHGLEETPVEEEHGARTSLARAIAQVRDSMVDSLHVGLA